jgi:16S rRNA (guanine527-N7)-methyltransferase
MERVRLINVECPAVNPPPTFLEAAASMGVVFDDGDVDRLGRFLGCVEAANATMNLTGIRDRDVAWDRHILDSLSLLGHLTACQATTLVDVGTGGGFPGIPLAIVRPEISVTLLEATGKKAMFLEQTVEELGLQNVRVVQARAEVFAGIDGQGRALFDVATARAVGALNVLVELCVPMVRVDGWVLAIKGKKAQEEIAHAAEALHRLHARVERTDVTATGTIISILKTRPSPKIYPRRDGDPAHLPLGGKAAAKSGKPGSP